MVLRPASDNSCCKNILLNMECGELGSNQASQYAEIYNNVVVKSFALVSRVELSSYPTATATIL